MKKAGIITFHCADNFGAFLQVYALQNAIERIEVDVEVIDFQPEDIINSYQMKLNIVKLLKEDGLLKTIKSILAKIYYYKNIRKRTRKFEYSRNKYLKLSKNKYFTPQELVNNPPSYDYFIAGSDQVWNPVFIKNIGYSYLLDFVKDNSSRLSYAASIAQYEVEGMESIYEKYLSKFNYISVREKSAQKYLNGITTNKIDVHLDPTLLIEKEQWSNLSYEEHLDYKYIFVYDLETSKEIINLTNKISEEKGYKVISYSKSKNFKQGTKSFKYSSPEEFIGLIKNAELIVSSSYHGIVFSIIYNKPFYAAPHKLRGSRIIDLLETLNLSERIISDSLNRDWSDFEINYSVPNEILERNRIIALEYLENVLEKN